jgi:hypothetical protein
MFQQCSTSPLYVIGRTGGRIIGKMIVRVLDILFPLPQSYEGGGR